MCGVLLGSGVCGDRAGHLQQLTLPSLTPSCVCEIIRVTVPEQNQSYRLDKAAEHFFLL